MLFVMTARAGTSSVFGWSGLAVVVMFAQSCALTSPSDEPVEALEQVPAAHAQPKAGVPAEKSAAKPPANVGNASWYGPGFTGKKTASGQIFDDAKFTAAHNTLPLGSTARITNLSNGKSVNVEVND